MHRTVVVKRELNWKAKLSIYQSISVPNLTCGHELWVVTERMRYKRRYISSIVWPGAAFEIG